MVSTIILSTSRTWLPCANSSLNMIVEWLLNKSVQKLILVIKDVESKETMERWVFDCDCNVQSENSNAVLKWELFFIEKRYSFALNTYINTNLLIQTLFADYSKLPQSLSSSSKTAKEVTQEIQAIMRQITASVTFLPLLSERCCFDLLVYADKDATVPVSWEESDPCFIANAEQVRLRSFNTTVRTYIHTFILSCIGLSTYILYYSL